ncbi:glycosyltransferase [Pseudoalteromonas sp. MEBiC 03485]|uniref:glycosyltransferase n=1 Tax=unclassified Pseudoalteromonas TaxID=194690 RepID=UPI0010220D5D|nr:glycosyltransferase [Pseudoalteromonas sp. MEBiC 03485]RZD21696.1 hypothetical protein EVU92_06350 [Pseudoalteromonas sp. MEBiC 03485]
MKILYIAYENVFSTGILQAQVITQFEFINRKYNVSYDLISTLKVEESKDPLYIKNRNETFDRVGAFVNIHEFSKTVSKTQSVISFIIDSFKILRSSLYLAKEVDIIHARSYGGGMLAYVLSSILRKPFIFDMRGILPEETVQVGKIKNGSFKYKLLKFCERLLINKASSVFTVSNNFSSYLLSNFSIEKNKIFNISNPTVYDNSVSLNKRTDIVNFLYSGSCQEWHCPKETLLLFNQLRKKYRDKVFLRICSADDEKFIKLADEVGLPKDSFSISRVPFIEMKDVYKEAHIGFCFRRKGLTSLVSCPVKFAEYISSGIYVVSNKGVSDFDVLYRDNPGVGLIYDELSDNMDTRDLELYVDKILSGGVDFKALHIPEFDWDYMSEQVYKQYKKILGADL